MFKYPLKTFLMVVVISIFLTVSALAASLGVLPDPELTPGATDPAVTQADIQQTVCIHGYTRGVRHVTAAEKRQDRARYLAAHPDWPAGPYEIDHLISLELGGSNDISNLWPEAYAGPLGARKKDAVENWLHRQVCEGHISLEDAQEEIRTNWVQVYEGMRGR